MTRSTLKKKKHGRNKTRNGSNEHKVENKIDVLYSQNICGIFRKEKNGSGRTFIKLDYMINLMIKQSIDAYLIQEYHLEGNGKTCINGYTIFWHNCKASGKKRGVAIILSPSYTKAWKDAGGLEPITTCQGEFEGRFIGLILQFPRFNNAGKVVKKSSNRFLLASVYHPWDENSKSNVRFNELLGEILRNAPSNDGIIIGADINAKVGCRDDEALNDVLGLHGLNDRNDKGHDIIHTYQSNQLCIMNTFFQCDNYITYKSFNEAGTECMLDICAVSKSIHGFVTDCRVVNNGVRSDHSAVRLSLSRVHQEFKTPNTISRGTLNKTELLEDNNEEYNKIVADKLKECEGLKDSYDDFMDMIVKAAHEASTSPSYRKIPWFEFDRDILLPLLERRNELVHRSRQEDLSPAEYESVRIEISDMNKYIQDKCLAAKSKWVEFQAARAFAMNETPRDAWKSVRELQEGEFAHHDKVSSMALRKEDGSLAQNDKENADILRPHLTKVYQNEKEISYERLQDVDIKPTLHELDKPITFEEFNECLNELKNNKAGGDNGVVPEMIKALDEENRRVIYKFVYDFFLGNSDFDSWHRGLLVWIHKSGRSTDDPNNYRGINLMDVVSKVLCRIVNKRLFILLDKYGTKLQFGGTPLTGCGEAIFTLKSALHARRNHGLGTFVAFIDLVKAYDTANHALLLEILERFGAPPILVDCVRRLYIDILVSLKIGKEKLEILQTVGVKQGDPMAPVLFLFLMAALVEIIDKEWKRNNILSMC